MVCAILTPSMVSLVSCPNGVFDLLFVPVGMVSSQLAFRRADRVCWEVDSYFGRHGERCIGTIRSCASGER